MNLLKRLFNKEISGEKLDDLLLSLGKDKKFINNLKENAVEGYTTIPFAYLEVKKKQEYGVEFKLELYKAYYRGFGKKENNAIPSDAPIVKIKKTISYEELNKNPILKKYVKGKSLEKSLAVLSVVSVLASAFFISNNITGNAILTTTSNSSGIIGAGLFVLGLVSWVFARNI